MIPMAELNDRRLAENKAASPGAELRESVLTLLRISQRPMPLIEIESILKIQPSRLNKKALGNAMQRLRRAGDIHNTLAGWMAAPFEVQGTPEPAQQTPPTPVLHTVRVDGFATDPGSDLTLTSPLPLAEAEAALVDIQQDYPTAYIAAEPAPVVEDLAESLPDRVLAVLTESDRPMYRVEIADALGISISAPLDLSVDLKLAMAELENTGGIIRTAAGWTLPTANELPQKLETASDSRAPADLDAEPQTQDAPMPAIAALSPVATETLTRLQAEMDASTPPYSAAHVLSAAQLTSQYAETAEYAATLERYKKTLDAAAATAPVADISSFDVIAALTAAAAPVPFFDLAELLGYQHNPDSDENPLGELLETMENSGTISFVGKGWILMKDGESGYQATPGELLDLISAALAPAPTLGRVDDRIELLEGLAKMLDPVSPGIGHELQVIADYVRAMHPDMEF